MGERSCRLCLKPSIDPCLNIFSVIGIEKRMIDILSDHFKCEINEADPLPNVVCHECWKTTEAFHYLYEKSKEVQQKFLNSLVKAECDPIDVVCSANGNEVDSSQVKEKHTNVDQIKVEGTSENSESDNEPLENDANESSNEYLHDVHKSESDGGSVDDNVTKNDPNSKIISPMRKHRQSKKFDIDYWKLFNENKHLFDLSCDFCSKVFESLEEARNHYSTEHNQSKGYIKSISGRKFYLRCRILEYLARRSNPEIFKCMECERMYTTTFELERHKKRHANKSTEDEVYEQFMADNFDMSCDLCENVSFTSIHAAKRHYKECHNGEKGYVKCCSKKLKAPGEIREHIKKHLNPDTFKCEVCDKRYSTKNILLQHRRKHKMTNEKSFICHFCEKSYREKKSLQSHLFTKHVKSEPKFECQICQKKFHLQVLLKYHMYGVHREKKPSVCCEFCGKAFYTNFHLNKHLLTHSDKSERSAERKQCEHCGEWLMTYSGIYYHKLLHSNEKAKCDECEMEFTNRQNLLTHIRHNHRAHKYKCSYCEKTFPIASKLRLHEVSHTRHKTYECKFCPKVFTVQSSRRTHTRRNHPEELKLSKAK